MDNIQTQIQDTASGVLGSSVERAGSLGAADLVLLAIGAGAAFLLMTRRTNIALAIFGLCVGYFFQALLADEIYTWIFEQRYNTGSFPLAEVINAALVFTPALLIVLRFSGYQKGRWLVQFVPIMAFIVLALLLGAQVLTPAALDSLRAQSLILDWIVQREPLVAFVCVMVAALDFLLVEAERGRSNKKVRKHQSRLLRR